MQCCYNLLGLFQTLAQVFMFYSVFALYFIYFPPAKKSTQDWRHSIKALKITGVFVAISSLSSLVVVLCCKVPSGVVTAWTTLLALIALVSSTIQFVPQIIRTYKLKMVGALSVPAMMMQTPGSFLFCYTIAISPGTNFTSWITYFVGGCLQGILLVLCFYYQNIRDYIVIESESSNNNDEIEQQLHMNRSQKTPDTISCAESRAESLIIG